MNLDDDAGFRYYRKAVRLRDLLTRFIEKADEIEMADEILEERDVDGIPPNFVVAMARKLEIECGALRPWIKSAAISLAKEKFK
jgi:hypothetical protein